MKSEIKGENTLKKQERRRMTAHAQDEPKSESCKGAERSGFGRADLAVEPVRTEEGHGERHRAGNVHQHDRVEDSRPARITHRYVSKAGRDSQIDQQKQLGNAEKIHCETHNAMDRPNRRQPTDAEANHDSNTRAVGTNVSRLTRGTRRPRCRARAAPR